MTFNPGDTDGTTNFLRDIGNQRKKIKIRWLSERLSTRTSNHADFADGSSTVNDPAEFAPMRKTPEPGDSGDEEKRAAYPPSSLRVELADSIIPSTGPVPSKRIREGAWILRHPNVPMFIARLPSLTISMRRFDRKARETWRSVAR